MPLLSGPSFLGPWVQEKRWVYTWAEVGTGAHLNDVGIGAALVRFVVLGILEQHLVHVSAGVLKQLVGVVEDDECNLAVTQHAQFVGLLHQPKLPLGECHLQESSGWPGLIRVPLPIDIASSLEFHSQGDLATVDRHPWSRKEQNSTRASLRQERRPHFSVCSGLRRAAWPPVEGGNSC